MRDEIQEFATGRARRDRSWSGCSDRAVTTSPASSHDAADLRRSCASAWQRSAGATWTTQGNCLFYLAIPPSFFGADRAAASARPGSSHEGDGKLAARHRSRSPSAATSNPPARSTASIPTGARRGPDLPHRPLPRQGDRPEHPGLPLRQRHLRADLEPDATSTTCRSRSPRRWASRARGSYYETAGALRDMVQNHMFQLLALVAMEPPISFAADAVRDEKVKVLRAIQPHEPEEVLRRPCAASTATGVARRQARARLPAGAGRRAGLEHRDLVALKLYVDNWRWAGVPFYLRTGKRLPRAARPRSRSSSSSAAVRAVPRDAGRASSSPTCLVLRIQPDEGISLRFEGQGARTDGMRLEHGQDGLPLRRYFGDTPSDRLRDAALRLMAATRRSSSAPTWSRRRWRIVTPILDVWRRSRRATSRTTRPAPGGRRKRTS